ncbi:unnamed protein product [Trichobilharzia szidati]|nr:unnamed protein product [Trichobilharzia szidati]
MQLQDYQHAISDLHIALSLGSKSIEANVVDQHVVINTGSVSLADTSPSCVSPSLVSANMNRTGYQDALLKTGQLHIVYEISDLLYTKAKILFKQSGQSITQAYYNVKRAIHHCPVHENSLNLLKQLESLSSWKQEEAVASMLRNRFIDALQSINTAICAQPENVSLYFDKGAILRKLSRLDESIDCILQGIELLDGTSNNDNNNQNKSSDNYQSLYVSGKNQLFLTISCYAIRLLTKGEYHESSELIRQLLKVHPNNYRLLMLFGDCQYQMNHHEEALKMYEKAKLIINELLCTSNQCTCTNNTVSNIPESVKSVNHRICLACYYLSRQKIKENDWLAALNHLNYCIQLAPFKSEFYMTRALVHYQLSSAKQSWEDVLIYIYLNLSVWALCEKTNGKWPAYLVWYQSMLRNRFISHVNEQIGPLIHRLTPKYIDLVKVARSKESEMCLMKNLQSLTDAGKCNICKNDDNNNNKTTTVTGSYDPIKFENQIDWLKNNISFDLFSMPTSNDISSHENNETMKCESKKCESQIQRGCKITEDYKQIKVGIQNIRGRKYLR